MSANRQNPYIGPRTFRKEDGHLFFGRDRESADLGALVASEKLVLFYAQSGAGKSSLINARLIPSLEEKLFEVLPVARLGGDASQGVEIENIYIYNLIRSLLNCETDPQLFGKLTLSRFLEKLNEDEDGYFYDQDQVESIRSTAGPTPWPRILIVDQFEEIFSTNVEAWQKREDFFRQLAQAMQDDPFLWVLLVMREDFVAALDPYAYLLPKGLRVRYYMERLSHGAAIQAIRSPVKELRPYADGVAEKLAEDLSRVKVQMPDGTTGTEPGQYIEPVQLQVVCYELWENLPLEGAEITEKNLQAFGDVNQSLGRYYDQRVSEVASAKRVRERQIREWFDRKLITAGGVRNMVLQQREAQPGELDDEVIQALQSDLVRAEKRGGSTWYELTHDRLVEPILASNKNWFELNLSPLQRQARLWEDQDRNDNWLLRDQAYAEVEDWVGEHQDELTVLDMEFLEASRKQRNRQMQSARRTRNFTVAITAAAAIAVILLIFAIVNAINANTARQDAVTQANFAQAARATAQANEQEAHKQAKISRAGELAAQSVSLRDKNFLLSLLLGVEAFKGTDENIPSVQAQSVLLANSQTNPQLEQFLNGNAGPVLSVAFSPDGKTLASGSYDKNIILWDLKTRRPINQLSGDSDVVRSIAFSPDGQMLASGSEIATITLWDVKIRQPIRQLSGEPGHSAAVTSVVFSPDGKTLASGSEDKTVILWDVETGQPIGQPLSQSMDKVRSVAFSPDGETLASGSDAGTILLWDVETGLPIGQPLSGHSESVRSVAFSPDGRMLASGSFDDTIRLWDVATRQPIGQPLSGHADIINSVAFSPDGTTLASGSGDSTIILWDMQPRHPISQSWSEESGHSGPITSIAYSPDGKTLASGSSDKTTLLWDVETGQPVGRRLIRHSEAVSSVAFSPDGRILASGSNDETIILWDVEKHRPTVKPLGGDGGHTGPVTSVAFSPDGRTLASGSEDATIILWDMETYRPVGQLGGNSGPMTSVAFSPNGKVLASGSEDTTITLWDLATLQPLGQLKGHERPITSVAFSPDGKTLASGSSDRKIILWNVETGQLIVTLSRHSGPITSVAFSPDGKTLASGSYDQTIQLWDVATYQPIGQPLSGHGAPALSVTFSPDGKTLASSSHNIILWNLSPQAWIESSCQRAGRNLTRAEWGQYFPEKPYPSKPEEAACPQWPVEPEDTAAPTAVP